MLLSEISKSTSAGPSFDDVFDALSKEFDDNESGGDDEIQLKGLDRKGDKITIDAESRRTEEDFTFHVTPSGKGIRVSGTSDEDIALTGSAQDVAYRVLSFISSEVENSDDAAEHYDGEDDEDQD
jgi:hypothetical protein